MFTNITLVHRSILQELLHIFICIQNCLRQKSKHLDYIWKYNILSADAIITIKIQILRKAPLLFTVIHFLNQRHWNDKYYAGRELRWVVDIRCSDIVFYVFCISETFFTLKSIFTLQISFQISTSITDTLINGQEMEFTHRKKYNKRKNTHRCSISLIKRQIKWDSILMYQTVKYFYKMIIVNCNENTIGNKF